MSSLDKDGRSLQLTAWRSLASAYRVAYAEINSDLRRYGLTPPQYSVMRTIGRSKTGSLAMNQISKELFVTYADVTLIVDNLAKQKCLKRIREKDDRRVVRIELTPKGLRLWKKIRSVHRKKIDELMRGLSSSELEQLIVNTNKIRNKILGLDREGSPERDSGRKQHDAIKLQD